MEYNLKFLKLFYDSAKKKSINIFNSIIFIDTVISENNLNINHLELKYLSDKGLIKSRALGGGYSISQNGANLIEKEYYNSDYLRRKECEIKILNKLFQLSKSSTYVLFNQVIDDLNLDKLYFYYVFDYLKYYGFAKYIGSRHIAITSEGIDFINQDSGLLSEEVTSISISPNKPYSNEKAMEELIHERSNNLILWIDKYFSTSGLDYLFKYTKDKVLSIKIITSPNHINLDFRKLFKKLKSELTNIDINVKILNDNALKDIHDRYFITEDKNKKIIIYNIPSPDIIKRSQLSDIVPVPREEIVNIFYEYYNQGYDLINDWDKICDLNERKKEKN
ncbi:MAG: hypothetical protein WC996_02265 [Peptostreptococcales bacterium]|nr:hypothetical protein [Candidatus ainarchaeum sp.]